MHSIAKRREVFLYRVIFADVRLTCVDPLNKPLGKLGKLRTTVATFPFYECAFGFKRTPKVSCDRRQYAFNFWVRRLGLLLRHATLPSLQQRNLHSGQRCGCSMTSIGSLETL